MKKRVLSLFLYLVFLMTLIPLTAFADGDSFNIWVNGTQATADNKDNILGDGGVTAAYDPSTHTLTLNGSVDSIKSTFTDKLTVVVKAVQTKVLDINAVGDVSITGSESINGPVFVESTTISTGGNVTLENKNMGFVSSSTLAITKAKDVTIISDKSNPIMSGPVSITADGNVLIEKKGDYSLLVSSLIINKAKDVTVRGNSSNFLMSESTINATGNVNIENKGTGFVSNSNLTINNAVDVTITASSSSAPMFTNNVDVAASGNVNIENKSTGFVCNSNLTINNAVDVTITASSSSAPMFTNNVDVAASGNVTLTNNGNSILVYGKLKVTGSKDVTITNNSTSNFSLAGGVEINTIGDVTITGKSTTVPMIYKNTTIDTLGIVHLENEGMIYSSIDDTEMLSIGKKTPPKNVVIKTGKIPTTLDGYSTPAISGGLDVNSYEFTLETDTATTAITSYVGSVLLFVRGDVSISNKSGAAVSGSCTVTSENGKISIEGNSNGPALITGDTEIITQNDVVLTNAAGSICQQKVTIGKSGSVGSDVYAGNVTITGNSNGAPLIGSDTTITANGDVRMENKGSSFIISGNLLVNRAKNMTVNGISGGAPLITGYVEITATDNVLLENKGTGYVVGSSLMIHSANDVTVTGATSASPLLAGKTHITATGNICVANVGNGGFSVNGDLKVQGAKNVTVSNNSSTPTITGAVEFKKIKGNILIVNYGQGYTIVGTLTYDNGTSLGYTTADSTEGTEIASGTVPNTTYRKIYLEYVCTHENVILKNAKDATCTAEGYTGDTYCKDCDEKIADGKSIPMTAHTYKDGKCTACGAADPNYKPTDPSKPDDPTSPQTGDSINLWLWFWALFVSGVVLFGTTVYTKVKREAE